MKNTLKERWIGLIAGLICNAFGNALSIAGNMGSGVWSASAVNLHNWTGISLGFILFCIGVINALTNQILIRRWDGKRFFGEVIFVMFFGTFVQFFVHWFDSMGANTAPVIWRLILSCLGIAIFCVGISLYQRANIFMHPNDDTTNILRFMYLKGNATASQLLDFLPPVIVIIIAFFGTGQILSINLATLFSILCNGVLIATSDRYIWPRLTHNFRTKAERERAAALTK
ncbi:sugar specific permease [Secundilactobacillus odoratitofui DSM 19909 = JCM 15043]|uniref:Sugar specific permease n=1 Tax=Secundilactobacillus odoratitofui DSM 19909 = JCM 15043 TaxID=1423776 RepID=A0A0R1LV94_9LACO|nr:sugar specific permease [Secundilactobacillus odoratitofui DSM 19909 = JCM 15043]